MNELPRYMESHQVSRPRRAAAAFVRATNSTQNSASLRAHFAPNLILKIDKGDEFNCRAVTRARSRWLKYHSCRRNPV